MAHNKKKVPPKIKNPALFFSSLRRGAHVENRCYTEPAVVGREELLFQCRGLLPLQVSCQNHTSGQGMPRQRPLARGRWAPSVSVRCVTVLNHQHGRRSSTQRSGSNLKCFFIIKASCIGSRVQVPHRQRNTGRASANLCLHKICTFQMSDPVVSASDVMIYAPRSEKEHSIQQIYGLKKITIIYRHMVYNTPESV